MAKKKTIKMIVDWNVGGTDREADETVICGAMEAKIAVDHGKAEYATVKKEKAANASSEA